MGWIKSLREWFRAAFSIGEGKIDDSTRNLQTNSHAYKTEWKKAIEDEREKVNRFKTLLARQKANLNTTKDQHTIAKADVDKLEKAVKAVMLNMKKTKKALQASGITDRNEMMLDPVMKDWVDKHTELSKQLASRTKYFDRLDQEVTRLEAVVESETKSLDRMHRAFQELETESIQAQASLESAKSRKETNDMRAGLSEDNSAGERLNKLRGISSEAMAEAEISETLSGENARNLVDDLVDQLDEHDDQLALMSDLFEEEDSTEVPSAPVLESSTGSGPAKL